MENHFVRGYNFRMAGPPGCFLLQKTSCQIGLGHALVAYHGGQNENNGKSGGASNSNNKHARMFQKIAFLYLIVNSAFVSVASLDFGVCGDCL